MRRALSSIIILVFCFLFQSIFVLSCDNEKGNADHLSRSILLDNLDGLSSSNINSQDLLATAFPYYLYRFEINDSNSQNKSQFLVCVKLAIDGGGKCSDKAIERYNHFPHSNDIDSFKQLNNWPLRKAIDKEYTYHAPNKNDEINIALNDDTSYNDDVRADEVISRKWYEGGTLHQASVYEWREATYENKLATCADIVASIIKEDRLLPSMVLLIESIDNIKPLARELVTFIDVATERDPDPELDETLYGNRNVAELAAAGVLIMGWIK